MICKRLDKIQRYCSEDISLIENYKIAVESDKKYVLHHKDEILLNVTRKWLIDNNKYYNVPANKLIFLTLNEHSKLHLTQKDSHVKRSNNYQYHFICPLKLAYEYNIKHVSIKELAKHYNCSDSTIYRRLKTNKFENKI